MELQKKKYLKKVESIFIKAFIKIDAIRNPFKNPVINPKYREIHMIKMKNHSKLKEKEEIQKCIEKYAKDIKIAENKARMAINDAKNNARLFLQMRNNVVKECAKLAESKLVQKMKLKLLKLEKLKKLKLEKLKLEKLELEKLEKLEKLELENVLSMILK